jgi:DNA-directed RNA polymerase subunit E'/Rpb7
MNKDQKTQGVYNQEMLTMKVFLTIDQVGQNIKQNLERSISYKIEGKCIQDGYIKPNSVRVNNYSAGVVNNEKVEFQTIFECMVCYPVEGMVMDCNVKTITKAGIHAEVIDNEGNMPITIFIARDHHFTDKTFANIEENSKIATKIIGIRFELNDPYICTIGTLDNTSNENKVKQSIQITD